MNHQLVSERLSKVVLPFLIPKPNGLDDRRRCELACAIKVFEYLQSYLSSVFVLFLDEIFMKIFLAEESSQTVSILLKSTFIESII